MISNPKIIIKTQNVEIAKTRKERKKERKREREEEEEEEEREMQADLGRASPSHAARPQRDLFLGFFLKKFLFLL